MCHVITILETCVIYIRKLQHKFTVSLLCYKEGCFIDTQGVKSSPYDGFFITR